MFGVSTQPLVEQRELKRRKAIPYPLLNDSSLVLAKSMGLPTFEVCGRVFFKRLTVVVRESVVTKAFHSILSTEQHAAEVLRWLEASRGNDCLP